MTTRLTCPYDEMDLRIASIGAMSKISKLVEEKGEQFFTDAIMEIMASTPSPSADTNIRAAKHYGVTPKELIDSPNYTQLMGDFVMSVLKSMVTRVASKFGLTDKEAWAVVMQNKLGGL